jgi:hypoxanthine phosphoribosyltransferase
MVREILIPALKIRQKVEELAKKIAKDYGKADDVILVIILEGASRFGTDIVSELFKLGIDFPQVSIKISSYGQNQESSRQPVVKTTLGAQEYQGKRAILIEDILETGHTLQTAIHVLKEQVGFSSVDVLCLLAKKDAQEVQVPIKYLGFWIGQKDWVDGYGIDTKEAGRGNSNIMVVRST